MRPYVVLVSMLSLALAPTLTRVSAQEYYADVRPLIEENCVGCHSDNGVAFSMEDPEKTYERRRAISRMVESRRMPPWLAEAGHQDYVEDLSLSEEQVETLHWWAAADFPKGEPRERTIIRPRRTAFKADVTVDIMPGKSYLPSQDRDDDYRCFIVDWPGETPEYITGFRTVPGNDQVAHHTVVYSAEPGLRDRFHELDEAEDGPGYECFGGALPDRLGKRAERAAYDARYPNGVRELNRGNFWLAHWAPGMFGQPFPEGTGILMEPGGVMVVQMHYYTPEAPGESDAGTTMEFQVAEVVDRPAFHLPMTYNPWFDDDGGMVIPPGEQATYEVSETLGDWLGYIAKVTQVDEDEIEGLEIHSANLHMHAFGHSGEITLTDKNRRKEVLLSIPRWDLAWQRDFMFAEPKIFATDDLDETRIAVECTYENPTAEAVHGGLGSFDEMCFNFSYVAVQTGEKGPVVGSSPNR